MNQGLPHAANGVEAPNKEYHRENQQHKDYDGNEDPRCDIKSRRGAVTVVAAETDTAAVTLGTHGTNCVSQRNVKESLSYSVTAEFEERGCRGNDSNFQRSPTIPQVGLKTPAKRLVVYR